MTLPAPIPFVTRRELADALGCHMQTVTKYEREGMPIAMRGDRGKPSRYDTGAVRAWLTSRTAGAEAPVAAIAVAEVRAAIAAEMTAVRTLLLSTYASRAERVHRAALLGVPGVARELQAITSEVLRTLALGTRPGEMGLGAPPRGGASSLVGDTVRASRAVYAPPTHLVAARVDATPVAAPVLPAGRRVTPSSYLGR